MAVTETIENSTKAQQAIEFAKQAEHLAQYTVAQEDDSTGSTQAVSAKFVTAQDPVIEVANGGRLPAVPVEEAIKLNKLKNLFEDEDLNAAFPTQIVSREAKDGTIHGLSSLSDDPAELQNQAPGAPLRKSVPPWRTNPLFPPLPMYGPPTLLRNLQCWGFRVTSAVLSLCFLGVIVLGAFFTSIPLGFQRLRLRLQLQNPDAGRPFWEEEKRRYSVRKAEERAWIQRQKQQKQRRSKGGRQECNGTHTDSKDEYEPLEGGPDELKCDIGYYARRVGLDTETFWVQTEDGFIIELVHVFNPREYTPKSAAQREPHAPVVFPENKTQDAPANGVSKAQSPAGKKRYPVLLMHGLLQAAGAYCCNDDNSLAFFLAKSGYDVWLGNNRCGFMPRHNLLKYEDPRMWAWNIRQMGVMDLPALMSRVLTETGFDKLGLIAHSQGTTQTLVALAKEQRPDIGAHISVFCALAPAAYAGPLIGKMYFKFMRVISPAMFRAIFGIHAFIPFMMRMHALLPPRLYGALGYRVFSFLFDWSDVRWERDLRARAFQFAPVYVSAESMRWWLGRECFARQKCILATREEGKMEDREDEEEDGESDSSDESQEDQLPQNEKRSTSPSKSDTVEERGRYAWYDDRCPPLAFWVAGADDLVDGRRLLRRFERGREPHVDVVHSKVIEGYEHLDVIWAVDVIEKVGKELREVIWRTAPEEARKQCRVPTGCEDVEPWHGGKGQKRIDPRAHDGYEKEPKG